MHSRPDLVEVIAHHESYDEVSRDDNGVKSVNRCLYRCVRIRVLPTLKENDAHWTPQRWTPNSAPHNCKELL